MPWSEISKGHFQRPVGENEEFIKLIGDSGAPLQREHWAVNADAVIKHDASQSQEDFIKHLTDAWQTLRFHHPGIAATAGATQIDYHVPDKDALKQWLSETFAVESGMREDVLAGLKPSPYAILRYLPDHGEVILRSSHWRTDGVGIMHLLDAFLELTSKSLPDPSDLPWGDETSRLCPPIEEAMSVPSESTDKIKAEAEQWTKTFHEAAGAVGIECSAPKDAVPAGTRTVRGSFSEATTEAIVAACKARDISVTSAVHASVGAANWALAATADKSKHWLSTIRFGLRPYLPEPFQSPTHGAALYTSGYMYSLPAGQSFEQNSRQINERYRAGLSDDFREAHRQYASNLTELIKSTPPDAPPASDVDISSVGLMDGTVRSKHGSLEVLSIACGVDILSRQMTCFVLTFRGQLSMNLVYNEAFYSSDIPSKFLETLMAVLTKELDVKV